MKSNLSKLCFITLLLVSYLRHNCIRQDQEYLLLCFLLRVSFLISTFRSFIYFDLILSMVWGRGLLHSFACGYFFVRTQFVEKDIPSLIELFWYPVENQLTIDIKVYFWILNSITLIYISTLMSAPHCLNYFLFEVR